jgi:alpha-tubulin suppressor-like RCC1 family protein
VIDTSGCSGSLGQCGNAMKEAGEDCDGSDLGGKDCVALGLLGGTLGCRPDCTYDASGCTGPDCGNGVIEGTEACDGSDLGGETCTSIGQGYTGGTLGCTSCQLDDSACFTCGNGTIETGEECEGTNLGGATCASLGTTGGVLSCGADCMYDRSLCFGCGNGVQETGEACDGTDLDGKTCATLGSGFTAGSLSCTAACQFNTSSCTQCGNAKCEQGETATSCPADCGVVDMAAGVVHTCAVLADGSVRCWGGWEGLRAGGAGTVLKPMTIPGIVGAKAVAAGKEHTCVLTTLGVVKCWGRSGWGQTGGGSLDDEVWPPVQVPGVTGAKALRAGAYHTCVITSANQVSCWGRGDFGELGFKPNDSNRFAAPTQPSTLADGIQVGTGHFHTCSVQAAGGARCWGYNANKQLGITNGPGSTVWKLQPTAVGGLSAATRIAGGGSHTCATRSKTGTSPVVCWGNNSKGQLGNLSFTASGAPVAVSGLPTTTVPTAIAAGTEHSCTVMSSKVWCWGANGNGQLGVGNNLDANFAVEAKNITTATRVFAGSRFSCAILSDKTSRCWGDNTSGQLGIGYLFPVNVPLQPEGL